MKRILIFSLIISFIFLPLTSCAKGSEEADTKTTTPVVSAADVTEAVTDMFESVGERDVGGEFKFLTLQAGINDTNRFVQEIYVESETGETINDAVFKRNSQMLDRFNVHIKAIPSMSPDNDARKSIKAGDNAYDIVNLYKNPAMNMSSEGLFKNFYDLKNVDYTAPWWSARCAAGLSVQGKLYNMSGSILISEIDDTLALVFNKKLLADYKIEDLYSLVSNKKWTIDKMVSIVKGISQDLNGDGNYKPKDDLFGYCQDPASMTYNWVFSSDLLKGVVDDAGVYQPNINIERCQLLLDKLYDLFADKVSAFTGLDLYEGLDYFQDNRILLYAIILRNLELLRSMDVDFGVLPYPLLDENQGSYLTHVGGASPIMCIPMTNSDDDRTGFVLEAMSIASYNTVLPGYYDIALKTKLSRDEDSSAMLDIILESRMYDMSYYAGSSLINMIAPVIQKVDHNFASIYEKQGGKIYTALQKMIDKITAIE